MVENVAHLGEKRYEYRVLVGKPEGKWPLGRNNNNFGLRIGDPDRYK